ncbi:heterokaryon incompatibility protein-domain-containing protein [Paraphoma chrysanthemicola]|uniref:Heterokaryon incompatibility protein-domain-containing protein n=1 Tax=Paraphoma chrysanthemicola TaxID=798071 RepID=A0A8K0QYK5_9PLEO|nr:heterokaryon incompatibility protein-domain-containing protein [Paraphoma chrysanthemicola]
MWLINTSTLALENFVNPEKESYAILSHTWGPEEVSFQDFHDLDHARTKRGFAKIQRTCEIARQRDLRYAWVDTCSIDKSSSAELSEAINSMFAWYKHAAVCLVYLEDLAHDVAFDTGFVRCKWRTRGWTLQELIAPQFVEFYDQNWTLRTTKIAAKTVLTARTGVSEDVLLDSALLARLPVARRMSWVSHRQTTRIEDMAYCMLGIFQIHMPLIYGEGEKSFVRLQEEIAKQNCDLSLFAWTAARALFLPPFPGVPTSVGGDYEDSNFRGILARYPHEFADCSRLKFRNIVNSYKEFTITNRGLRIEAQLMQLFGAVPDDLVLNLGVCYENSRQVSRLSGDGWMGIYVRKTTNGYLRVWPHELYKSGPHNRVRCPRTVLYIRKDITNYDIALLRAQYTHAVRLDLSDLRTAGATLVQTHPFDLWDAHKQLFLDPGEGVNVYCEINVPVPGTFRPLRLMAACSTMTQPTCVIWTDRDVGWNDVLHFLGQANEITDYVAVDFLVRDLVPTKRSARNESVVEIDSELRVKFSVTLERAKIEDSDGFVLRVVG